MAVLRPDDTCWRIARADRAAVLVDNQACFAALYAAFQVARRSVLLLGWGFDPRTRLLPDGSEGVNDPDEVGRLLVNLAKARPELDIRLLVWKSALPISASQDFFPHKARRYFADTPVKFRLDAEVPLGACHHQKLVVIDDRLAFCGGGDISVDRWDSVGHLDGDPRRIMPGLDFHPPRHEVTMMVDGPAARALGDLVRERWRRASGEVLNSPAMTEGDPWPRHVEAQFRDLDVAIARTQPAWRGAQSIEEIRRLNLASIYAAERTIYLENQYLTSPAVTEVLAQRLAEPHGPEVVLISSGRSPSWFDQLTMDRARAIMVWRLQAADIYGRFRAYWPRTTGGEPIIVHSKVSIFDDRLVRVGSANLNNRSGGFDTECELAARLDTPRARAAGEALRDRLVGHFLGCRGDVVAELVAQHRGVIPAIEALNREGRLQPILHRRMTPAGEFIAACHLGDPASVADSWRPGRRRERLFAEARATALTRRPETWPETRNDRAP